MSLQIGRVGTETSQRSPMTWEEQADGTVSVSGTLYGGSVEQAKAFRRQLLGHVESARRGDERHVPVIWTDDTSYNGWYTVLDADVEVDVRHSLDSGHFPFRVQLERLPAAAAGHAESRVFGTTVANSHSLGTNSVRAWHAVPTSADTYDLAGTASSPTTRTGSGSVRWYSPTSNTLFDATAYWRADPSDWYDAAATVKVGGWVATGRQEPNLATNWQVDNGLVRVGPGGDGSPPLFVEATTTSGSGASYFSSYIGKPTSLAAGDVMVSALALNASGHTVTPPSGWTLLTSNHQATLSLFVMSKTATSSDVSATNFETTWTGGTYYAQGLAVYRGSNVTVDSHNIQYQGSANTDHLAPSVTGSNGQQATVVRIGAIDSGNSSREPTWTTATERCKVSSDLAGAGNDQYVTMGDEEKFCGTSGTSAFTIPTGDQAQSASVLLYDNESLLAVESHDGSAWQPSVKLPVHVGFSNGAFFQSVWGPSSVQVLRAAPEEVAVRVSTPFTISSTASSLVHVDVSLRRGSRFARVAVRSKYSAKWGLGFATNGTATADSTHGIYAGADDGDGNRWFGYVTQTQTHHLTNRQVTLTTAGTELDGFVGQTVNDSSAVWPDDRAALKAQGFSGDRERLRVVQPG